MMPKRIVILAAALIGTGACTEQTLPVLNVPVPMTVPSAGNALGPRLSQGADEATILSWMERDEKGATLKFSRLALEKWQVATAVTSDSGMFVNWADLPAVTATSPDGLLAHWLSYSADAPYAYDVLTAQSTDLGMTWSAPLRLHTDGTQSEHGFVSPFPTENGVGMIWLDGRKTVNTADSDHAHSGMTLRGATLSPENELQDEVELDDLICDCCQTDVAVSDDGPVAVYRNRTVDEIRDIYVARQIDKQWQPGVPLWNDNWHVTGCPVNGPAIDAHGELVVVAWFSAANDKPVVRAIVSKNSGASFSEPVEIASDKAQGRVGITLINDQALAVSWLETENDAMASIKVRTMTLDGQLGPVTIVGRSNVSRTVPQLTRVADNLILAWTDEFNDKNKILSVRVPILGYYDD